MERKSNSSKIHCYEYVIKRLNSVQKRKVKVILLKLKPLQQVDYLIEALDHKR